VRYGPYPASDVEQRLAIHTFRFHRLQKQAGGLRWSAPTVLPEIDCRNLPAKLDIQGLRSATIHRGPP
jgi:hypothetical protein